MTPKIGKVCPVHHSLYCCWRNKAMTEIERAAYRRGMLRAAEIAEVSIGPKFAGDAIRAEAGEGE